MIEHPTMAEICMQVIGHAGDASKRHRTKGVGHAWLVNPVEDSSVLLNSMAKLILRHK
ncbi:MAG: hypothetical protein AB8A41_06720 [Prochlorococcus sp.]